MSLSWISDSDSVSGAEDDGARDPSRRIFHGDGTQSRVYRQLVVMPDGRSRFIAIKVVSFVANSSTKPHDIVKEARLLQDSCDHPNIISPYDFIENDFREQYELIMPLLPLSLTTLLESPEFAILSPTEDPPPISPADHLLALPSHDRISWLEILAKSICFQTVLGLDYLHGLKVPIAHRDVKPENVLLDKNGCVKLIDFGIAWECVPARALSATAKKDDVSPYDIPEETPEAMVCQVGSGSYRAIELLFSPPTYDALAADLWSLGVTLCMFYTELRWVPSSMADDESDDDGEEGGYGGNRLSRRRWSRKSMFKASRGEIGLIWSIFRLLGTPTEDSWPSFTSLPGAHSLSFNPTSPTDIRSRLAYFPSSAESSDGQVNPEGPLHLIQSLLMLDPSRRLSASAALRHPWFWTGEPLLLPPGFPEHMPENIRLGWVVDEWNGYTLRDIYHPGVERAFARYREAL